MANSPFLIDKDVLNLSDGTTLELRRTPGMGDKEWEDTKKHLEANPEEARRMEKFARDAKEVRAWMQTQALTEYYNTKLNHGDQTVVGKLLSLEQIPELAQVFNDVRQGGAQAAMRYYRNEPLLLKVSRAMGGIPDEVKIVLEDIQSKSITLQEACMKGDVAALETYLRATENNLQKRDIDGKDAKGITCLGYAIGANRTTIVKLLLEAKANPWEIDTNGGTAIHYAAAYGRKELLEYFISAGGNVNQANTQGQTPLVLAMKNKMKDAVEILKANGGKA